MFRFREEVEQLEEEVESRNLAMADLREELNKLGGDQIHLQAQRLQMENQVGVEQACTDKGEEDFRAAQSRRLPRTSSSRVSLRRWSSWRGWPASMLLRWPP